MLCTLMGLSVQAQEFEKTTNGVKVTVEKQQADLTIEWYTPRSVRVLKTPQGKAVEKKSLSVIAAPGGVKFTTKRQAPDCLQISTRELSVKVNTETGVVSYYRPDGTLLVSELPNEKLFTPFNDAGRATYTVYQGFDTDDEEGLYGLGQLQNGQMMQRNMTKLLVQGNVEDVSPIIQSTKGYGIYWDNYSATTYTDNKQETSFSSEVGDCADYYFMYGKSADGVVACVRQLTGDVPMMPLWSYGFMQSRERYKSQDETVGVVRKYRELGIPLDCIIQDWQYWGSNYLWNAMDFLNENFSNPRYMIDQVHGMNARMMISIWSSFGPKTLQYNELDKKGLLFDMDTWPESGVSTWPPRKQEYPSGVRVYNPYAKDARDIYWKYLNKGLFQRGIDSWWMDSTDPDHFNQKPADFDRQTGMGTYRSVRNAFALMTVGGVYDNQRATTDSKRVCILTRSGYLGQQRYGANVWSGDVQSTWDMFRRQVTAGLNWSLTGMPHWNSDLGGFFAGIYNNAAPTQRGVNNPRFQELYTRWMQFGTFCPMMRSHGTEIPREIYYYGKAGDPIYDALLGAVKLRYTLLPYIYSTSWQVTRHNSTFMRALFMDFVDDKQSWDIKSEYMFGDAFLVAPVLHAQYTPEPGQKRQLAENEGWSGNKDADEKQLINADFTKKKQMEVYLPAGTRWYDFWTNAATNGGQKLTVETQIDRIPLFVRAGSIVPMGPDVQYSGEKPWDELTIRIYPGANAEFTLYEDEGDNYNYEKGAYSTIAFRWDDRQQRLTIDKRIGNYEGMIANRKFRIVLMEEGNANGREIKTIDYTGKAVKVKI